MWQPHLTRAILVAAGDAGNLKVLKSIDRATAHIIGIDGGADALAALGMRPDAVLGDMDSTSIFALPLEGGGCPRSGRVGVNSHYKKSFFSNFLHFISPPPARVARHLPPQGGGDTVIPIISLPAQNQSDLEKSIVYLLSHGVRDFTIYGALGGARMDHQIANLDLLAKYAPLCRIAMVAVDGTVIDGLSAENTAPDGLDFPVRRHSKLGVLPAGGAAIVTLRGTAYDLDKAEIQPGTHGVGNIAVGDRVHIQVHSGMVRFIYQPS